MQLRWLVYSRLGRDSCEISFLFRAHLLFVWSFKLKRFSLLMRQVPYKEGRFFHYVEECNGRSHMLFLLLVCNCLLVGTATDFMCFVLFLLFFFVFLIRCKLLSTVTCFCRS